MLPAQSASLVNSTKYSLYFKTFLDLPGGSDGEESACNARDPGSIPGKSLWRREWPPTPVFLPGEFHGQRSEIHTWVIYYWNDIALGICIKIS